MLVTSVNPQISLQVEQYPQVKAYIERATHRLPDGVGVVKMSKYWRCDLQAGHRY